MLVRSVRFVSVVNIVQENSTSQCRLTIYHATPLYREMSMKKYYRFAIGAVIGMVVLCGCTDTSPIIDYYDSDLESVSPTHYTLNQLQSALEEQFDSVTYVENESISAGPLTMYLEKNGTRLTILETVGDVNFLGLLAYGYSYEEVSTSGIKMIKWREDDKGRTILNTERILMEYLEMQ